MPRDVATRASAGRGIEPPALREVSRLDEIDTQILSLLANDARLSVRAIGRELGMSAGAISERIDRLERNNVIDGYHAAINWSALGFGMEVIVGLRTGQGESLDDALAHLAHIPEVASIRIVAGVWDVVLVLRVSDHNHLREVLLSDIWKAPGFRQTETLLVLDNVAVSSDYFGRIAARAAEGSRGR